MVQVAGAWRGAWDEVRLHSGPTQGPGSFEVKVGRAATVGGGSEDTLYKSWCEGAYLSINHGLVCVQHIMYSLPCLSPYK